MSSTTMTMTMKESMTMDDIISKCKEIVKDHPENRCCKYAIHFLSSYKHNNNNNNNNDDDDDDGNDDDGDENEKKTTNVLSNEGLQRFYKCIKTGMDNPQSSLGCYAMDPNDYTTFHAFFDPLIRDYHNDTDANGTGTKKKHVTSWDTKPSSTDDDDDSFDVRTFGLDKLSMRVRVGRNLVGHKLPGSMTKECRIAFEKKMMPVFEQLMAKYGGRVYSLSPDLGGEGNGHNAGEGEGGNTGKAGAAAGESTSESESASASAGKGTGAGKVETESNPNLISEETYRDLVDAHVMFKDMSSDPFLQSAGISNDWPYGRGCWQSEDKMRVIWFGEEDQLRIMCMKDGTDLHKVFSNLKELLDTMECMDGIEFAKHDEYGYITSCPSNLGTGMRASVHMKAPVLTIGSKTDQFLKEICAPLNLSVRGTGGEHTPIVDGTVDISPSSRLFVSEGDILSSLYSGIKKIATVEKKVASFLRVEVGVGSEAEAEASSTQDESKVAEAVKEIMMSSNDDSSESETPNEEAVVEEDGSGLGLGSDASSSSRSLVSSERSFVLVDGCHDNDTEEKEQADKIRQMKEQIKAMKISTSSSSSRSMNMNMNLRSPSSLHLSPSCVMAIKNE